MINEEIKQYVADQRAAGFSDDDIRGALTASGWSGSDIATLLKTDSAPTPATPKKPGVPTPQFSTVTQQFDTTSITEKAPDQQKNNLSQPATQSPTEPPAAKPSPVAATPATAQTTTASVSTTTEQGPANTDPSPNSPVTTTVFPASVWRRFFDYVLDAFIFIPLFRFIILLVIGLGGGLLGSVLHQPFISITMVKMVNTPLIGIVIWLGALFAYYIFFESLLGKTIGKSITGTKVVRTDGTKPHFWQICGRTLARFIPFEAFSFVAYGRFPTKGWHDRLSGTLVVPKTMTPEHVRSIDSAKIAAAPENRQSILIWFVIMIPFIIAIIAILAAVVLTSLNADRTKGADAMIKSSLNNMRAEAALFYDSNNSTYVGLCSDPLVQRSLSTVQTTSKQTPICNTTSTTYVMAGSLSDGTMYCVDSTGVSSTTSNVAPNQQLCDPNATPPAPAQPSETTSAPASSPATSTSITAYTTQFYATHQNSYQQLCSDASVKAFMQQAAQANNATPICDAATSTYRIALKRTPTEYNCIDSTGLATTVPSLPSNVFLCSSPGQ